MSVRVGVPQSAHRYSRSRLQAFRRRVVPRRPRLRGPVQQVTGRPMPAAPGSPRVQRDFRMSVPAADHPIHEALATRFGHGRGDGAAERRHGGQLPCRMAPAAVVRNQNRAARGRDATARAGIITSQDSHSPPPATVVLWRQPIGQFAGQVKPWDSTPPIHRLPGGILRAREQGRAGRVGPARQVVEAGGKAAAPLAFPAAGIETGRVHGQHPLR